MIRSHRKYTVELRVRHNEGGVPQGVVARFLYTDKTGQDWVQINKEWFPVDDRLENPYATVFEMPRDLFTQDDENVMEFEFPEAA